MSETAAPEVQILDLLDASECVEPVVGWIDAQWAAMSGRTRARTLQRFTQAITRDRLPVTLVAVVRGMGCVGVASLRERDSVEWLAGVTPWVCNVYVSDHARGLGIAGRLCLALEVTARRLGYDTIYLATSRPDSLYHRIGYREIHRLEYHGEQEYVLCKGVT